ncbi:protoheme IX farnesyltransferase [Limisalsivibrio acetivorans]|uniref:protoheme IX farnesyltransferase n=1 Tax=Limisalsivibrio acetivorans TaxID=1304888 RepID=UPI0003B3CCF0|nr:UbiA family prenyltransferase [Limisalsivibrio acetivorans]
MNHIKLYRPAVSLAVGLAALAGSMYHIFPLNLSAYLVCLCAVLLSAGCSALNQYQERDADALMERTMDRPIPSGRLAPGIGLGIAVVLILLSLCGLYVFGGLPAFLTGTGVTIVYNFVYTPLKRITPYALLIGSTAGAAPFYIGWAGSGGAPFDYRIMVFVILFFLWQTPHFVLLAARYYDEYEKAGFLTQKTASGYLKRRLMLVWTIAYASMIALAAAGGVLTNDAVRILAGVTAIGSAVYVSIDGRKTFAVLNASIMIVCALAVVDKILMNNGDLIVRLFGY